MRERLISVRAHRTPAAPATMPTPGRGTARPRTEGRAFPPTTAHSRPRPRAPLPQEPASSGTSSVPCPRCPLANVLPRSGRQHRHSEPAAAKEPSRLVPGHESALRTTYVARAKMRKHSGVVAPPPGANRTPIKTWLGVYGAGLSKYTTMTAVSRVTEASKARRSTAKRIIGMLNTTTNTRPASPPTGPTPLQSPSPASAQSYHPEERAKNRRTRTVETLFMKAALAARNMRRA